MKFAPIRKRVAGMIAALAVLTVAFSSAFFLTSFVYGVTGWRPQALVAQLVNSLLGVMFVGLIVTATYRIFGSGRAEPEARLVGPLLDALAKIAAGDFSIRLDENLRDTVVIRDTVVAELVKSVNRMAGELSQMEAMRQEFISNVSHEIQSPLTSIRGFARALQDDRLDPEDRTHYLTVIEAESARLSRIADNLLRLASLESEQVKFEPKPYRLDRQIRSLILACEPQWAGRSIEMDVTLEEVAVTADEDLMSQVWLNLIHNAIKFTPEGGSIHVDLRRQGGTVEFRISDTGIGISQEDQARVFERFYKADRSHDRSKEGSGLGLSIVRKIVEMHGGTIAVQSTLGAGATFTVTLPAK